MICQKCNCQLETLEEVDILALQAIGKNPPIICTECVESMFESDDSE